MFQDPTAIATPGGTGIAGWRVSGSGGSSSSPASALLVAGPTSGEAGAASEPFIVSANGSLLGSVTITPSAGGGAGSFSPPSQVITSGQVAQFVFTPAAVGSYTVSFTNSAALANPAPLAYASVSPAPPPLDIENNWLIDVSPTRPWLAQQGSVPANCLLPTNKAGQENKYQLQYERADPVESWIKAEAKTQPTTDSTWVAHGSAWLSRVADPVVPTRMAFKHLVNKTAANWSSYPTERMRAQITGSGETRYEPWGYEQWAVTAVLIPAAWSQIGPKGANEWQVIFEWHDAPGGLTKNPPFAIEWISGVGNADANKFGFGVKRYSGNWPTERTAGLVAQVVSAEIPAQVDAWTYFMFRFNPGCGFTCPVDGQIYGPVGEANRTAFIKCYVAHGESGVPQLVSDYQGFWGSPIDPSKPIEQKRDRSGKFHNGIYTKTDFNRAAATDDRIMHSLGWTVWRATDIPAGVSAAQMLAAFKALRGLT